MENRKLSFDYFHAHEAGQFTFYRIPKALFSDGRFSTLSGDAKILYGLLLDRMGLSLSNEWLDSNNHVYIYYPVETAMQNLNCAHGKVAALFKELTSIGLILKKRQGLGKPDIIYVMNFASGSSAVPPPIASDNSRESLQPDIQKAGNQMSRYPKNKPPI